MAHVATCAAIKTAIDEAFDTLVSEIGDTPLVKELEACMERTISDLKKADTISSAERIQD